MRQQISLDIDPEDLVDAVGQAAYGRGARYARDGAVRQALWNRSESALVGTVSGSGGQQYTTTAFFSLERGARVFDYGDCSCPVGADCKHVAAMVLYATGMAEQDGSGVSRDDRPGWEQALGSLLRPPEQRQEKRTPLALELTLSPARGRATPKLFARLMRPGKRGGWAAGQLSWNNLATLHLYHAYDEAQLRLLRELHTMSQSRHNPYYGYYGEQKTIDLSTFESPRLWSMLAEARSIGIRLVHGKANLGDVELAGTAEVRLDVTSGESDDLRVTPEVVLEGSELDPVPLAFVGTEAHGVVLTDRSTVDLDDRDACKLWLAELANPVSRQLQQLVCGDARLDIPGQERERFTTEFYPRLRRAASIVSSDESFTPPVISEPTLALHAAYGAGHELELTWEWAYQVGESELRVPTDHEETPDSDTGVRDQEAERAVLQRAEVSLEKPGFTNSESERTLLPQSTLDGVDTMRFTTEVLPLLSEMPDVDVRTSGEQVDYREAGDSLRIGVSTEELAGERDWFGLGVSISVEGEEVPFVDVFTALANDEPYLLCDDGAYFSLERPELQRLRELIEEARALQDTPSDELRISRFQAGLWDELRRLGVVDHQARAWQQQVEGLLAGDSMPTPSLPDDLATQLRPYQADGFAWLTFLWQHQLGGILADDMGLGKTLQTLALLRHARRAEPAGGPFLIVAPASVVRNWAAEAERFTPDLTVVPVRETLNRRGQSLDEVLDGADMVVTSYTLLRLDFDSYGDVSWAGLVLDEAQFVKNHQSKLHQCARRCAAPFKLAITGTPIENNLMELWSMLSITAPGLFPDPTRFRDYYSRPIERGGDTNLLAQLRRRIKPLVKRRTKELVEAELPAKQEQVLEVELGSRHRKIYDQYLQRERQKVLGMIHDMQRNRLSILRSLTLLRQLSLHPALVDNDHATVPCGKIDALVEQLREVIDGGHRALVFSQFTGFLDMVRSRLEAEGVSYSYLDGKTRDREKAIENFKQGSDPAFLISLKAGGFGLNLTEADYCFLLDPWWNPATETQAVDRTHRIGQTRGVMVYRFISAGTIEEKVAALKQRKADLFTSVMDEGDAFGSALEADDIRALFE